MFPRCAGKAQAAADLASEVRGIPCGLPSRFDCYKQSNNKETSAPPPMTRADHRPDDDEKAEAGSGLYYAAQSDKSRSPIQIPATLLSNKARRKKFPHSGA
jgi:hypothetical protein